MAYNRLILKNNKLTHKQISKKGKAVLIAAAILGILLMLSCFAEETTVKTASVKTPLESTFFAEKIMIYSI